MRLEPQFRRAFLLSILFLVPSLALAQDQFAFMPSSGPELLVEILDACESCDDIEALASLELEAEGWQQYFEEKGALEGYDGPQVEVLTSYLAINFPSARVKDRNTLPRGGRSMAINNCQLCHSIAVPMTQARPLARWMDHRSTVPHDSLSLTAKEWDTLATYLTLVAPLPLEAIPEQLRRGAGGY